MAIRHLPLAWISLTCLLLLAAAPSIAAKTPETPVVATKPESPVMDQEGHVPTSGSMRIEVRLPDGNPAGARLMVNVGTKDKSFDTLQKYRCDEQGRVEIDLPKTLRLLRIWIEAEQPGYVPLFAQWWPEEDQNIHRIPAEFTFNIPKGTTVGGTIIDSTGKPIEGVEVEASLDLPDGTELSRVKPTDAWNNGRSSTKTDSNGRWSFDWIPAGDVIEVDLTLSHPDFISDGYSGELQRAQGVVLSALRDHTATIVMQPGVRVAGVVRDAEGNPIEKAVILWGKGNSLERSAETVTDEQGRFELPPVKAGKYLIAVVAKGWMPALQTVETGSESEPLEFQLKRGKKLRLTFVDPDGHPVSKVGAYLKQWRELRALDRLFVSNVSLPSVPLRANEAGIYKWNWAPDDPLIFVARVKGFADQEFTVTADETKQSITLTPELTVTGTVTDAETGDPIPEATVMQVLHFTPNFLFVNRSDAVTARNGQLEMVFHRTDAQHGIRIECEGYRTKQVGPWKIGDENPVLEIEMEPVQTIQGYVVDESGAPAKDASVYLVTATQALDWSYRDGLDIDSFKRSTDADGRYSFPAQFEPYFLVAATDRGYAEVEGRPDSPPDLLQLKQYARVEGRVLESGKPVVGQQVTLSAIRAGDGSASNVDGRLWTTTDSEGRYMFEKIPPVKSSIRPYLSIWRDFKIHAAESIPLDLQPGQNLTVDLNAGGHDVTGSVKLTGDIRDKMNLNWSLNYLVARREGITPPQALIDKGLEKGTPLTDSLASTPEGLAYRQTLHHHFVKLNPDGMFHVSGVAPGEYDFFLKVYEPPQEGCLVNPIAAKQVPITVPASEGTVDLGEISLEAIPALHPGDVVPDIVFQTLDGETRKISDYRGKYLLIDVWATWCAPCVAALPELETLHGERGEELQILGLNIDENKLRAKAFLEERELDWPQGVTDDPSGLMTTLGVSSAPTYLLIDPEGRLMKRAVRLSDLEAELNKL